MHYELRNSDTNRIISCHDSEVSAIRAMEQYLQVIVDDDPANSEFLDIAVYSVDLVNVSISHIIKVEKRGEWEDTDREGQVCIMCNVGQYQNRDNDDTVKCSHCGHNIMKYRGD